MIQRLVLNGAAVNGADYDLRRPLHIASCAGQVQVAGFLLGQNANIDAMDRWGNTALAEAIKHKQTSMVEFLVDEKGAKSVGDLDVAHTYCTAVHSGKC